MNYLNLFILKLFAKEVIYDFVITEGIISSYGFLNKGILINGEYPGPDIHVDDGDTLIVNVENRMSVKNITIHYHGIRQKFTQSSDGVPMVTQYPIAPGQFFQHNFPILGQPGTYYYHAHTDLSAIWLHGALIVHEKKEMHQSLIDYNAAYAYDDERIIMLSEGWDNTTDVLMDGLKSAPFRWVNNSRAVLMNAQTFQPPTPELMQRQDILIQSIVGFDALLQESYFERPNEYSVVHVDQGIRYRFRLIGATDLSFLKFSVPGHQLTIIEIDGIYVDPITVDYVQINNGQRYSVILEAKQPVSNYLIFADPIALPTASLPNNGIAILSYNGEDPSGMLQVPVENVRASLPTQILDPLLLDQWIINDLTPSKWYQSPQSYEFEHPYYRLPLSLDREIILEGIEERLPTGGMRWQFSNQTYADPQVPFLEQLESLVNGASNSLFEGVYPNVYEYTEGDVIQVVIQNTVGSTGTCDEHPWHLHGHTFHVVGMGSGRYNPHEAQALINANIENETTIFRDTATIYPFPITTVAPINASRFQYPEGTACGWMAIRFRADNPGAWLMHCHITPHMMMGKRLVMVEKPLSQQVEF